MKTRSYNLDHLIYMYQTFIKKDWGSDRGIHSFTLFFFFAQNYNLFLSKSVLM